MSKYVITGHTGGPDDPARHQGHSAMKDQLDLVTEAVIRIAEKQVEQERAAEREATKSAVIEGLKGMKQPVASKREVASGTGTRASLPAPRERPRYINADGEEWTRKGWKPVSADREAFLARRGAGGRILNVGDIGGATTTELNGVTFVRRGCLIDGSPEVVQDKTTIGKFDPPWKGGLCRVCHEWWTDDQNLSDTMSWDGIGLFVSRRLQDEGYIDPGVEFEKLVEVSQTHSELQRAYLADWATKTWAIRVLKAADPAIQEPPRRPFGFLGAKLAVLLPEETPV